MKKSAHAILVFALLVVAAVAISGCSQYGGDQAASPSDSAQPSAPPAPPALPEQPAADGGNTVEITAAGFNPNTFTVQAGEAVVFVNKDATEHWPASAAHPTHVVYPEPGGCIGSKFDACKSLATGEPFMFVFNQKGSWKYHDHLNCCSDPAFFGTIVVE